MEWYRSRSLWLEDALEDAELRPSLEGEIDADVAIVGGGLIGVWLAYTLAVEAPELNVVILERDVVGFGAAGRNGGWAGAGIAGSPERYARSRGWDVVREGAAIFRDAVADIGRTAETEQIDCGFIQGGTLAFASSTPQAARLHKSTKNAEKLGIAGPGDRMLNLDQAKAIVDIPTMKAAHFTPDCARIDPAILVRDLAASAERRGVRIFEDSEVIDTRSHKAITNGGRVNANRIVLATEAWAPQLPGGMLTSLPLTSMMIATEPLPEHVWDEIGWPQGLTVRDKSHLFFYAQRTRDNRIAIGGRGSPYRLSEPYAEFGARDEPVWQRLRATIDEHFPAASGASITHSWGGILAVPRDWSMSIRYDHAAGIIRAGGLAGHGVVAANVVGRTIADMLLDRDTKLTRMPWVEHRSRRWEPEPARFIAANAIVQLLKSADDYEDRTDKPASRSKLVAPFMPPA
ncbi:MAG: NAD(P)/FAD-dependent oxidoreductase [Gulosibacter sp.]